MLPIVTTQIADMSDKTPTELHHVFSRVFGARANISTAEIERLMEQMKNDDLDAVEYTALAYTTRLMVMFGVMGDVDVDMDRVASAVKGEMDGGYEDTKNTVKGPRSAVSAFIAYSTGYRYYEKILSARSRQVLPNQGRAIEQAEGKKERQKKIYEEKEVREQAKKESIKAKAGKGGMMDEMANEGSLVEDWSEEEIIPSHRGRSDRKRAVVSDDEDEG